MFTLAADKRQSPSQIANELNRKGIEYAGGKPWNKYTVGNALKNEKYTGCNVWGRTTKPFSKYTHKRPRNEWTIKPDAFIPLIDPEKFARVQELMHARNCKIRKPDSYFLDEMRRVLKREGKLSQNLLKKRGVFDHRAFTHRFGSMKRAYE